MAPAKKDSKQSSGLFGFMKNGKEKTAVAGTAVTKAASAGVAAPVAAAKKVEASAAAKPAPTKVEASSAAAKPAAPAPATKADPAKAATTPASGTAKPSAPAAAQAPASKPATAPATAAAAAPKVSAPQAPAAVKVSSPSSAGANPAAAKQALAPAAAAVPQVAAAAPAPAPAATKPAPAAAAAKAPAPAAAAAATTAAAAATIAAASRSSSGGAPAAAPASRSSSGGAPAVAAPAAPAVPASAPAVPAPAAPIAPAAPAAKLVEPAPAAPNAAPAPSAPAPERKVPGLAGIKADDARAAWNVRPSIPVRLLDSYVNFMCMGESGLGKTTFINNLVSSYNVDAKVQPHDGSSTSLAAFQNDPSSLKTVLAPMEVAEAGRRLHVSVQDMPGWGDDINLVRYLRVVVDFILQQRQKDYDLLSGSRALNETAMCGQLQHSLTAVVYFLAPHRVKKVDLIIMSALSQLVTVIPVIAKGDSMTDEEMAAYRTEIRSMLNAPSKYAPSKTLAPLEFNSFGFSPEVLEDLGLKAEELPLSLVTSNDGEPLDNLFLAQELGLEADDVEQPVRRYRWGAAYAYNPDHSGLLVLKRLLLGDNVNSLYAMLDESYSRYVNFCEEYEGNDRNLSVIVQNAAAMCTPYLEYDDYTNAKGALDSAQQAMSTLIAENRALMDRISQLEKGPGGAAPGGAAPAAPRGASTAGLSR